MEAMREIPDKAFDLAIVDPPYRDAKDNQPTKDMRSKAGNMKKWHNKPGAEYFAELFRISQNQIIWGANNFLNHLRDTNCIIFWDKKNRLDNFSDGELAWTSFDKVSRCFEYVWVGNKYGLPGHEQGVGKPTIKIHPTEKPVKLYEWILTTYAKEGDKILDTHLGSGSIAIACYNAGYSLTGYEIDTDYYEAAMKRLEEHKRQGRLFDVNV